MLANGTTLGPYEILGRIGAGGMGEVYRAHDTRLARDVAVKVLPANVASDPHFRGRFEREAKAISQLSHPNICILHDVGDATVSDPSAEGGPALEIKYLVMEFLDGESLAQRLARGPLPIEHVLRYGGQIADALERAHREGIIHRDLKPSNVMITKSGAKLLDFGLAKRVVVNESSDRLDTAARTESIPLTSEGAVVGTYQYMAPEQLAALEVDARTDVFSFGALLYEMTTGRPAFEGKSRTGVFAAILTGQPRPMQELQPLAPRALEHLILRCLAKEPDDRWQTMHDVRAELEWISRGGSPETPIAPPKKRIRRLRAAIAVGLVVALAGALSGIWLSGRRSNGSGVVTAELVPPGGQQYVPSGNSGGPAVISPDGRWIVYSAVADNRRMLWLRSIESGRALPLADSENAIFPFWAPDSRRIAFFAEKDKLRRVEIGAEVSFVIASCMNGRGGAWAPDGTIIFSPGVQSPLYRVSENGGAVTRLTTVSREHSTHRWPALLPDGNHFLFFAADHRNPAGPASGIFIASLDDPTPRLVLPNPSSGIYADGRLLFAHDGVLYSQSMSADGTLSGNPGVVARDVMIDEDVWRTGVSASNDQRLVYYTGEVRLESELLWVDRAGKPIGTIRKPDKYWEVAFSPDGSRLALSAGDPLRQLWIEDLARQTRSRLTLAFPWTGGPIWSRDGASIYFTALDGTKSIIVRRDVADGTKTELLRGDGLAWPSALSPDGSALLVANESSGDVLLLRFGRSSGLEPFIADPHAREITPVATPDGKWIAYASNESGRDEVYVVPFADPSTRRQVSRDGGKQPLFRPDARELYYADLAGNLVAVPVNETATDLTLGAPERLFQVPTSLGMSAARVFAPTADGQRFVVVRPIAPKPPVLRLVSDWRKLNARK